MDAAALSTRNGLAVVRTLAAESFQLADTLEAKVNALEVEPWALEARDDWWRARTVLQEKLAPEVLWKVQTYVDDLRRRRTGKKLGTVPLKVPGDLTPLNAGQVPIELAAAIVGTGGTTGNELREAKDLVEIALVVYEPLAARPFMLTETVRRTYRKLASVIGDPRVMLLAQGRGLSEPTVAVLRRVSNLASIRLREAKA
jgi:hypothetical protein